ncbi:MAG: hypothetical protein H6565_06455 [Lewinellaceae bacterium]|nr:hypothetical protein [Saprospiraceae bacterium]MCB0542132.1 hypothetical protein [Saprospiraceae bacterium]MCB9306219.1 hypothetical protein [Lewinellaceae bacterium]MCB9354888.1 hypothetical protein [Lewinellaceae bacterium]
MNRKQLPKSFFLLIAVFSLFSFLFVNLHSGFAKSQVCPNVKIEQAKMEDSDDSKATNIPIPDITVIERLWRLAQKVVETAS